MAEFTRTIVSRFRQYIGERRRSKRHKVRLAFSISVPDRAKSFKANGEVLRQREKGQGPQGSGDREIEICDL